MTAGEVAAHSMYWKGLLLSPCSAMSLASSFFRKGAKASLREGDKEEEKKKKRGR